MTHVTRHLWEHYGDAKRELQAADEEMRMALLSDDWEKTTWARYGRASALARAGELSEARSEMNAALELLGAHRSIIARPVAVYSDAFVSLQESAYDQAFARALECQSLTESRLGVFLFTSKGYPLAVEAGLGPNWHDPDSLPKIKADKQRMRKISWVIWKCLGIGALFKVVQSHCFRVRGRHAFVMGNPKKALRLIDRAILSAEQHGLPYDRARALLDRSLINGSATDRELGQLLLRELHSVLPIAEQKASE
jgi:tetratricopeptide (TPR) repeat protein